MKTLGSNLNNPVWVFNNGIVIKTWSALLIAFVLGGIIL